MNHYNVTYNWPIEKQLAPIATFEAKWLHHLVHIVAGDQPGEWAMKAQYAANMLRGETTPERYADAVAVIEATLANHLPDLADDEVIIADAVYDSVVERLLDEHVLVGTGQQQSTEAGYKPWVYALGPNVALRCGLTLREGAQPVDEVQKQHTSKAYRCCFCTQELEVVTNHYGLVYPGRCDCGCYTASCDELLPDDVMRPQPWLLMDTGKLLSGQDCHVGEIDSLMRQTPEYMAVL